ERWVSSGTRSGTHGEGGAAGPPNRAAPPISLLTPPYHCSAQRRHHHHDAPFDHRRPGRPGRDPRAPRRGLPAAGRLVPPPQATAHLPREDRLGRPRHHLRRHPGGHPGGGLPHRWPPGAPASPAGRGSHRGTGARRHRRRPDPAAVRPHHRKRSVPRPRWPRRERKGTARPGRASPGAATSGHRCDHHRGRSAAPEGRAVTPPRVPVGDALCVTHRGQVLRCEVTDAATIHRWLSGDCPGCSAAVDGVARLLGPEAMIVSTWDALLSRQEARELITWHEAGHAVMAHRVGARVREVTEATDAVYSHCGTGRSGGHCQWTGDVTPLEDLGGSMAGLVATQDWLIRHGYDEPSCHVAAVLAAGADIDHARQELGLGEYIPTALETLRAEWPHRRAAVQRVAQALQQRGRLGEQEFAQLIAQAEQDSAPTVAEPSTR